MFYRTAKSDAEAILSRMASGDLTVGPAGHKYRNNRLLTLLSKALHGLQVLIRIVERSSRRLHVKIDDIKLRSGIVLEQVQGVTATIKDMAEGIQSSAEHTRQVSEAVSEIYLRTDEVDSFSRRAAASAGELSELAREGRAEMAAAVDQMQDLTLESDRISEGMRNVQRSVAAISDITRLIEEISSQTRILSLNANIEAVRAGEHGRGFGVVAGEISKLAIQTQNATAHIGEQIEQITASVEDLAESFGGVRGKAQDGFRTLNEASRTYTRIETELQSVNLSLKDAGTMLTAMKERAEHASEAIRRIADLMNETAAGSEEILASAEVQQTQIEAMDVLIREAGESSEAMRSAISQFKLPEKSADHPLREPADLWVECALHIRSLMVALQECDSREKVEVWQAKLNRADELMHGAFQGLAETVRHARDRDDYEELKRRWGSYLEARDQNVRWAYEGEYDKAREGVLNTARLRFKLAVDFIHEWLERREAA